jgi:tRNA G18 (ribose-2'-O)-methylase SpoU
MNSDQPNGVSPHPQPWPTGDQYDSDLLEHGDSRNVIDKYRYWKVAAIKADLDKSRLPLEIAVENWQHDFNIGTIIRTANAFNVRAVHIIGRRHYNRRGAMVTDAYMNIEFHETVGAFRTAMQERGKVIVAVDNVKGATNLSKANLPEQAVLVFGGEGPGVSQQLLDVATQTVMIEQLGSTRSINVGVAAGIVMYEWLRQNHSL